MLPTYVSKMDEECLLFWRGIDTLFGIQPFFATNPYIQYF